MWTLLVCSVSVWHWSGSCPGRGSRPLCSGLCQAQCPGRERRLICGYCAMCRDTATSCVALTGQLSLWLCPRARPREALVCGCANHSPGPPSGLGVAQANDEDPVVTQTREQKRSSEQSLCSLNRGLHQAQPESATGSVRGFLLLSLPPFHPQPQEG